VFANGKMLTVDNNDESGIDEGKPFKHDKENREV
jgi:hypothetical protein